MSKLIVTVFSNALANFIAMTYLDLRTSKTDTKRDLPKANYASILFKEVRRSKSYTFTERTFPLMAAFLLLRPPPVRFDSACDAKSPLTTDSISITAFTAD